MLLLCLFVLLVATFSVVQVLARKKATVAVMDKTSMVTIFYSPSSTIWSGEHIHDHGG